MDILLRVIIKEFLQLRRDSKMIPMLLIGPIVQILAFGYAANTDVNLIPTVLVDLDRSSESRALVDRFLGSGYFDLVGTEKTVNAIDPWLLENRAQLALVIGAGYGQAVAGGLTPRLQIIADGSDANSAVVGLGYAARIIAGRSTEVAQERLRHLLSGGAAGSVSALAHIEMVPRIWYNPNLKSRWFYVPAVLAMVLMLVTMILSAMAVVREKEIGTMEQLIVTPIRPWQLIVGKLLPFALIGLVETFIVVGVATVYFGVPLRGSFPLLVALTMLFVLTTLGLGLLVSTLVRTQQQAMLGSVFLVMIPMIYLSGLIFPIENMPMTIQYVTYAIPLRYYAVIIRGIFLKASGIDVLWPEALRLALFGISVTALAAARFRKRLD